MNFLEAEQTYRELEDKLVRGELAENEFLAQVALLRLSDREGRRWMISGQTGRWLVYDGQQWVFADPPLDEEIAELETQAVKSLEDVPTVVTEEEVAQPPRPGDEVPTVVTGPAVPEGTELSDAATTVQPKPAAAPKPKTREPRSPLSRVLVFGIAALIAVGCLGAGGISVWVLFLRDMGEPTPPSASAEVVGLVETFTPRPSTPTYTPTPTPTPSRAPTPTITPTPTDTALPTPSQVPASPTATNEPTSTGQAAQTHLVQAGETLSEIAARYGITVQVLAEANGITNQALLRAGQLLIIPAVVSSPGASTVTSTWTPIVLSSPEASATSTALTTPTPTSTTAPTATSTRSGPTPTRKPTATPTPKPPSISGKIAFAVWNAPLGKYELFVSLIDGSGLNKLGTGFRQPQFRNDGSMLVVNGDGADNLEHLVIMDSSGAGKTEISNYTEDSYPSWRHGGGSVVYSSTSWGDGKVRLGIVYDLDNKGQDWIPFDAGRKVQGEYPYWMADGRIVYRGCEFWIEGANCALYVVPETGGTPMRITDHESDRAPAGAGQRVAFMSSRDGNWEVYVVSTDGSGLKRLTNNDAADGLPTWSPDGKSIAFVSNRSGAWAIWVMDANGASQRKLFDLPEGGGYGSGEYGWTTERISWAP